MQSRGDRLNIRDSLTRSGSPGDGKLLKNTFPYNVNADMIFRDVVDGIFWGLRIGNQWRNMPEGFPAWQSVYRRAAP